MFYSQNGEDRWLSDNFGRLALPAHGTFVDVGAGESERFSNTLWLEEYGWSGLLIEPDSRHHDDLVKRRRVPLERSAIGAYPRPFNWGLGPLLSGFLRPPHRGIRVNIPVRKLTDVLDDHGITTVDVLSIDTEGTELEVWQTLDKIRFRPTVVIVEWETAGIGENAAAITTKLVEDGYKLATTLCCNLIFELTGTQTLQG